MILGIGIDTVDIARFARWHMYKRTTLTRIFSDQEIDYCLQNVGKSAQRFAVRFAAREALYKALASYTTPPAFLTLCAATQIAHGPHGAPLLVINWDLLHGISPAVPLISLSHTDTIATAIIFLQVPTPPSSSQIE